jgi:N-acetylglucosamine-6-phosphate deacetylase
VPRTSPLHPRQLWLLTFFTGLIGLILVSTAPALAAEFDQTVPVDGLRENLPRAHVLTGALVVAAPGELIEAGTIVIRDGVITEIGPDVEIPPDARHWDLTGKTIYPGFVDAYGHADLPEVAADQGTPHWSSHVQPQRMAGQMFQQDAARDQAFRSQGITVRLVAPSDGIIRGQSVVITTGNGSRNHNVLVPSAALHVRLTAPRGRSRDQFPSSPMGAVALARQTFYDARWYRDAWHAFHAQPGLAPPERNTALEALLPYVQEQRLVIFETPDEQYLLRAERFAREFGLRAAFLGSGHEYRRIDAVRESGRPVIVGLKFPDAPDVGSPESAAEASLEQLMHWDLAPENAARLHKAGVTIALTAHGLDKPNDFLENVRKAVERGLEKDAALAAMTVHPAQLLGIDQRVGTLQRGKLAHLVVSDGDLFEAKTKIVQTWVDGVPYELQRDPDVDLRGRWQFTASTGVTLPPLKLEGDSATQLKGVWLLTKAAEDEKPENKEDEDEEDEDDDDDEEDDEDEEEDDDEEDDEDEEDEEDSQEGDDQESDEYDRVELAKLQLRASQLVAQFPAKVLAPDADPPASGVAQLSVTVTPQEGGGWKLIGQMVDPQGMAIPVVATQVPSEEPDEPEEAEKSEDETADASKSSDDSDDSSDSDAEDEKEPSDEADASDQPAPVTVVNFPLGDYGRSDAPEQPASVLFRQATVWTCGEQGVLERADVLVVAGRIERVAEQIDDLPEGTVVIDCQGRHLSPGIIDCHSHMATDGGVNEGTQAITAEVRIGDFIDGRDINIYRQLAGGVTAANILHGSANPIGGQNQVIKLRWGALPEEMKFVEAPAGIKFALGENVKQSNWGDRFTSRYPQSRMGVEQIIRDAFLTARQYRHRQQEWQRTRKGLPPRYDLELETLAEIQSGERWIHCHSYRQDEILALLRTLESLNIQIGTLQHILEGYKVAEAIKQHGAMASSFSDWWAYKVEVFDAIPFNGALMHDVGVVVSFNSDDAELARHLNHEAAKAVKYGDVPPHEALKFVTLNPARQLRIDEYVGSIEPGKHADLVVWSGPPLSTTSRCEQTWIDGRKYFDREEDVELQQKTRTMRAALIQKILDSGAKMQSENDANREERDLWPRVDIYCRVHAECLREILRRASQ